MKKNLFLLFSVSILCLTTAIIGFAQEDSTLKSAAGDLYIISAKAGGVNYVEGSVSVQRKNGETGYLVKGDRIEVGDKVMTSSNSRIEVLMNPGSFVRLDYNSEFEFITTSLDDLKLQVNKGSAIFEVFASNDFKVTVNTPKAKFYLVDTGVYRVDILGNGIGKVEVHRGKAQVGSLSAQNLKKGRTATVDSSNVTISKFNHSNTDEFERWSKSRAKLIAKANKKLAKNQLQNTLLSTRRIDCFNSFGLWVFNRRFRSYSFLPYGYGWRSPYGYRLRTNTGICDYPFFNYYDPYYTRYPRRIRNDDRNGGGGDNTTRRVPAENSRRARRNRTPPFRRIERTRNVKVRRSRRAIFTSNDSSSGGSTRSTRRTSTRSTTTSSSSRVRTVKKTRN